MEYCNGLYMTCNPGFSCNPWSFSGKHLYEVKYNKDIITTSYTKHLFGLITHVENHYGGTVVRTAIIKADSLKIAKMEANRRYGSVISVTEIEENKNVGCIDLNKKGE